MTYTLIRFDNGVVVGTFPTLLDAMRAGSGFSYVIRSEGAA